MSPFTRTLVVGAGAAATLPLAIVLLAPLLGGGTVMALHAVVWTAAWLGWLSRGPREAALVAATVVALGAGAWLMAGSLSGFALGLGVLTAVVRSGWLYGRGRLRGLVLEVALLLGACATAAFLFGPGLAGAALAVWGWFVVQSLYFLVGGARRRHTSAGGDAFEEAARRLESLLDTAG